MTNLSPSHSPSSPHMTSFGGFRPMASNVIVTGGTATSASAKEREARILERDIRAAHLADHDIVKLASVRMEGWEREKEVRVRNAFDRIVDRGWYDKSEHTLKVMEMGHINAVREHFAMRRDKIKTPALVIGPAARGRSGGGGGGTNNLKSSLSNRWNALEWADNVNAVDDLSRETNLQDHFMGIMQRKMAARQRREAQARNGGGGAEPR